MDNYLKIAQIWRSHQPSDRTAGVVLIWQNKVYGWKDSLRDASHERPGVIAVDADDHIFIAEGGDEQNGAKQWVVVS
uniref:Antirestriction protein ArdR n=1 Tax=Shewanella putrefaciens (strain 200) TaxID=399804 RepID=E6XH07_SHEP2